MSESLAGTLTETAHERRRADAVARTATGLRVAAALGALYLLALAAFAWAAGQVSFAANEGSAYYVAVARNIAAGRGMVVDAIWSYATPPLSLPRPAFELWQPLASLIAAGPMAVLGPALASAQLGSAIVAALLAPLAWLIAREASLSLDGDRRRAGMLALGSGLLVGLVGPFVVAVAMPDSTIPFAVSGVVCCWLIARSLRVAPAARTLIWLALGLALGVAWLARHEAVWIALAALAMTAAAGRLSRRMVAAATLGGLVVTVPWLLRNLAAFGTPLPGQALDNALLTSNEQIFGYLQRPSLEAFLGQGPAVLLGNIAGGAAHNLVNVLLVPAAPVAVLGAGAALIMLRRPALRASGLAALLFAGTLILSATTVLFPIATRWGTFEHAAGPLLLGLTVGAVVAFDQLVQAVGRRRGWRNSNAWLAPLTVAALLLPLTAVQLSGLARQAETTAAHQHDLASAVLAQPAAQQPGALLISDHPVWLAESTGLPAIALPPEPLDSLEALSRRFAARLVVISGARGGYPALLRSAEAERCFVELPVVPGQPSGTAIFEVLSGCR